MVGSSTRNPGEHLQGLATADQIVIATSTRRLVGRPANNSFEFIDLGEQGTGCQRNFLASLDRALAAGEIPGAAHVDQPRGAVAEAR